MCTWTILNVAKTGKQKTVTSMIVTTLIHMWMTVSKTARSVLLFTYVHLPTHITHCHPLHEVDRVQRGQHL